MQLNKMGELFICGILSFFIFELILHIFSTFLPAQIQYYTLFPKRGVFSVEYNAK
jgi:hypothetical protein